ncbi:MAG TPA: amidohydrolase family protein [Dehalococcoidia bacterium]|nr:amidohydrolase family protein [Dehalococcoidia bacterium]
MATLSSIISADSHMLEPADLWTTRLEGKWRDNAPRVYWDDKQDALVFGCEGIPPARVAGLFAAGVADEDMPKALKAKLEDARPGGWDPAERLKDMAVDSVEAEVLYTTLAFNLFWSTDGPFQEACFKVYNDWLAEFCSYDPTRFVGVGLISLYDLDRGIAELERCKKLGLGGAMIWASPPPEMAFIGTYHDKFWAAAQEMDIPISLHILTGHGEESKSLAGIGSPNRFLRTMALPNEIQRSLSQLIFGGTFDRFPRLKIVSAENEIGWVGYYLYRADRAWRRFRHVDAGAPAQTPSDYFRRNIWVTFIDDPIGLKLRHDIGVDRIMWSNDYPHQASSWPHSMEVIERDFVGVSDEDKAKICRDNAATLYGFDLKALAEKPLSAAAAD